MRKFLKIIVLGIAFSLVIIMAIEHYQAMVINNDYSYKSDYMEKHKGDITTLLLGNSFIHNSINPNFISDSIFDLALSSRWIYYDKELLKRYITQMPNLRCVIFGMGYAVPFWRSYHFPEEITWHGKDFISNQKYLYEKFMDIRYDRLPYYYWFGFIRGYIDRHTLFENSYQPIGSLGYDPLSGQMDNWQNKQNIDPTIIYNPHAKEQITEYTEYIKEMAELCNKCNVRFIVVTPPCHDSYIVNVRQEGLDILHGMIENIRDEYPIEYIDYLKDEEFRADSIYYNCSHLNSIGADMFALRVKKDFGL